MKRTIDETARRRSIQLKYNQDHHITPQQIVKDIKNALQTSHHGDKEMRYPTMAAQQAYMEPDSAAFAADPIEERMSREQLKKSIENTTALMKQAAKELDFLQAAQYRDEVIRLQSMLDMK